MGKLSIVHVGLNKWTTLCTIKNANCKTTALGKTKATLYQKILYLLIVNIDLSNRQEMKVS